MRALLGLCPKLPHRRPQFRALRFAGKTHLRHPPRLPSPACREKKIKISTTPATRIRSACIRVHPWFLFHHIPSLGELLLLGGSNFFHALHPGLLHLPRLLRGHAALRPQLLHPRLPFPKKIRRNPYPPTPHRKKLEPIVPPESHYPAPHLQRTKCRRARPSRHRRLRLPNPPPPDPGSRRLHR